MKLVIKWEEEGENFNIECESSKESMLNDINMLIRLISMKNDKISNKYKENINIYIKK